MVFFDYVYYFFCNLYKQSKSERETQSGEYSGIGVAAGSMGLFCISVLFFIDNVYNLNLTNVFSILGSILLFNGIFFIRYNKFTTYIKVKKKFRTMKNRSLFLLKIFLLIYFLVIIIWIVWCIYIGYQKTFI